MEEVVRQSLQMNLQQKWTKSHHRGKAISSILLSLVGFHKDTGCCSEEMGVLAANRLKGKVEWQQGGRSEGGRKGMPQLWEQWEQEEAAGFQFLFKQS